MISATETIHESAEPGSGQDIALFEADHAFDYIDMMCLDRGGTWRKVFTLKFNTVEMLQFYHLPLLFKLRYSQPSQFMTPDGDVMPQTPRPEQSNLNSDDAIGSGSSLT